MKPGIYTMSAEDYHEDCCDTPSLSASLAHILCTASPRHAWAAHPRLNPDYRADEDAKFDVGTVAHAILLQGLDIVEIVDAPDWRTKEAKEARSAARAAGRVPLLAKTLDEVQAMVAAAREQLEAHHADPPLFTDGKPEQTLVWEQRQVLCRARLDWLRDDFTAIDDLKTTAGSAHPSMLARRIFDLGYDLKAAFYISAVEALTGKTPEFRWVFIEKKPPYALSVVAPDPDVLTIGRKKVQYALDVWRKCLRDDEWPGYPTEIAYTELPPWEEVRWLEREMAEAA